MNKKQVFYDRHGVEEYYLYDPERNDFSGWMRSQGRLHVIDALENWVSPRQGIRFDLSGEELQIYRHDGEPFASYEEVSRSLEQAEQRAAVLAERLRSMGIDPQQL